MNIGNNIPVHPSQADLERRGAGHLGITVEQVTAMVDARVKQMLVESRIMVLEEKLASVEAANTLLKGQFDELVEQRSSEVGPKRTKKRGKRAGNAKSGKGIGAEEPEELRAPRDTDVEVRTVLLFS